MQIAAPLPPGFLSFASSRSSWFPELQERTFSPFQTQISHPVLVSLKVQNIIGGRPSISDGIFFLSLTVAGMYLSREPSLLPKLWSSVYVKTQFICSSKSKEDSHCFLGGNILKTSLLPPWPSKYQAKCICCFWCIFKVLLPNLTA